ncbi:MAG TPA: DUF4411 domain-containing protein [Bacteroidales bacterium]|nr:DUF4411 domain-containing protein [Bacteroidales bacterium]
MIGFFNPKYVIDTGPLIDLKDYYADVFVTLWENLDSLIRQGDLISSSEVYRELKKRDDEAKAIADKYKFIFRKPEVEEQRYVKEILANHRELIKQKNIDGGLPVADPFIIALAICNNAVLITSELFKINSHNIPNICKEYKIECINLKGFFIREGWKF